MQVNRSELLNRLLSVEPGISKQESIQQSSCVIFRKGKFYTLNQEVACAISSGLDKGVECAVKAEKLIELLKQIPEDDIELELADRTLNIKGVRKKAKLVLEKEILLPVEEVELPSKWCNLHEDFTESVDLVHRCTKKKDDFIKECVHIHPQYLESFDNIRMIRYQIESGVSRSTLVRGGSIKAIVGFGMTRMGETENWLHFRNPMGLRMSIRSFPLEDYPALGGIIKKRGTPVSLPKGLQVSAKTASLFEEMDQDGTPVIQISVTDGRVTVEGRNVDGEFVASHKAKHQGKDICFAVQAKMIMELVKKESRVEITDSFMRVDGGKWVYVQSLEMRE